MICKNYVKFIMAIIFAFKYFFSKQLSNHENNNLHLNFKFREIQTSGSWFEKFHKFKWMPFFIRVFPKMSNIFKTLLLFWVSWKRWSRDFSAVKTSPLLVLQRPETTKQVSHASLRCYRSFKMFKISVYNRNFWFTRN